MGFENGQDPEHSHLSQEGGWLDRNTATQLCTADDERATFTVHCISSQAVRALAAHPTENTFTSGAADNIKKFKLPYGEFLHNTLQQQKVPPHPEKQCV